MHDYALDPLDGRAKVQTHETLIVHYAPPERRTHKTDSLLTNDRHKPICRQVIMRSLALNLSAEGVFDVLPPFGCKHVAGKRERHLQ